MSAEQLAIKAVRIDGGTQSRVAICEHTVSDYAATIATGTPLPLVVVFFDGLSYWLADGFHRINAASRSGAETIDADVRIGTQRDAVLFSVSANHTHGLRRSIADKQKAVATLLDDAEWCSWSDREIAKQCGVSHPFVAAIRSPEAAQRQQENRARNAAKSPAMESDSTPAVKPAPAIDDEAAQSAPDNVVALCGRPAEASEDEGDEKIQLLTDSLHAQHDEITALKDRLSAFGPASEDQSSAVETIAELRQELKVAYSAIDAITQSRDQYMSENAQLKRQVAMMQREAKKVAA